MSNETTQAPEKQYVISEGLLNDVLAVLGELPLKNSINLYLRIQQTARPLVDKGEKEEKTPTKKSS